MLKTLATDLVLKSGVVTACLEAIERKSNNRTFEENVTA
jgi:hypothetical protein